MITSTFNYGRLEIYINDEFNTAVNDLTPEKAAKYLEHFKFMYQIWNG